MKGLAIRDRLGGTLDRFRDEMDETFTRLFGDSSLATGNGAAWSPRVDVTETDTEFLVKADVPGVELKDLDVTVNGDSLVLKGEKKEERNENREGYHRYERFFGSFYREVQLPTGVDVNKITAEATKGVVTVHMPKVPGATPKKVPVRECKA